MLAQQIHDYNVHVDRNDVFRMIPVRHNSSAMEPRLAGPPSSLAFVSSWTRRQTPKRTWFLCANHQSNFRLRLHWRSGTPSSLPQRSRSRFLVEEIRR